MRNPVARQAIVFGYIGDDWSRGLGRHSGLMFALAERVPVVLLSGATPGKLPDRRPLELEQRGDRLFVVHHVHRWQRSGLGRRWPAVAEARDGAELHRFLCARGFGGYVLWLLHDELARWRGMSLDRVVFDSIDPCFEPNWREGHERRERALAKRAKVVFCTAESLLERVVASNPRSYLLPNGCAADSFTPPAEAEPGAAPVVGYLGTFDERVDIGFLEALVASAPDARFVLAGRINARQEAALAGLRSRPNVRLPGRVSYDDGHRLLASFDVGLIPFRPGPMGDAINPVKLWTYLAAGKPVVSTVIRECVRLGPPCVFAAAGHGEAPEALRKALAARDDANRATRVAVASANTWSVRADEALRHLRKAGLLDADTGAGEASAGSFSGDRRGLMGARVRSVAGVLAGGRT